MSKHTPGPWRVGDAGHTIYGPKKSEDLPNTVAELRNRVNCHLIAAAPEMLEFLKWLQNHYTQCEWGDLDDNGTKDNGPGSAWLDEIIAKAEGK